ncbi:hypothetical protein PENTCL1PPCAC_9812, partial [Pristionchus entomophagus]
LTWLESRESRKDHACPLCRQRVDEIKANNRVRKNLHLAFGKRQPDITFVVQMMHDLKERRMECIIRFLKGKNRSDLATVRSHRNTAVKQRRKGEYLDDIVDELQKLEERVKTYDTIHKFYKDGYDRAWNDALERIRNGELLSDYESDSYSDVFPDAESGDEENEVFREEIDRQDTIQRDVSRHRSAVTEALRQGDAARRERNELSPHRQRTLTEDITRPTRRIIRQTEVTRLPRESPAPIATFSFSNSEDSDAIEIIPVRPRTAVRMSIARPNALRFAPAVAAATQASPEPSTSRRWPASPLSSSDSDSDFEDAVPTTIPDRPRRVARMSIARTNAARFVPSVPAAHEARPEPTTSRRRPAAPLSSSDDDSEDEDTAPTVRRSGRKRSTAVHFPGAAPLRIADRPC